MFEHLKKYEVNETTTAEFVFEDIVGQPVMIVAPFNGQNKELIKTILKQNKGQARKELTLKDVNVEFFKSLCVEHVLRDWRGVKNSNGEEVPFTKENAKEFLGALPDWLFLQLVNFATNSVNFVDTSGEDELLGN